MTKPYQNTNTNNDKHRVSLQFTNVYVYGQYVYNNIFKLLITYIDENQTFDKGKDSCFIFGGLGQLVSLIFQTIVQGAEKRRLTLPSNGEVQVCPNLC